MLTRGSHQGAFLGYVKELKEIKISCTYYVLEILELGVFRVFRPLRFQ